jgi:hypothetical protein
MLTYKTTKSLKDKTKPEGFHTEFKRNVKYIFWSGTLLQLLRV